jgi:hypothetical protein
MKHAYQADGYAGRYRIERQSCASVACQLARAPVREPVEGDHDGDMRYDDERQESTLSPNRKEIAGRLR